MTQANNDRSDEFPDGSLPSNHSTHGVCECKHAISNIPKGKNHTLKDRENEGPRHVSETGNEVPGKHVSNNGHWLVCGVRCGTILLKVADPEEKNADHLAPCSAYLLSTTHSKDVRFPWVTLYYLHFYVLLYPVQRWKVLRYELVWYSLEHGWTCNHTLQCRQLNSILVSFDSCYSK